MKSISWTDPSTAESVVRVLGDGGLVCLPCTGRYRIVADLLDQDAVFRLMQAKGRVTKAPALVFVKDVEQVARLTDALPEPARTLAGEHWPGPLTIRVPPGGELTSKVVKQLGGKKARLGVRVPNDPWMQAVLDALDVPLLVSSANRPKKAGDSSPAQVRKTFARRVDLFVDAGELQPGPSSTVVEVDDAGVTVARPGVIALGA